MKLRQPKEASKSKFSRFFIPIFILVTLVLSAFGIIVFKQPDSETFEYKNSLFIQDTSGFSTRINNKKTTFLYDPRTLENLPVASLTLTQFSYGSKFYLSANPNEDVGLALYEFNRLIVPLLNKRFVQACSVDVQGCENTVLKTCADATPEEKVVLFKESNSSSIAYNLNCLTIQGSGEEMTKLTNKLALNFLFN